VALGQIGSAAASAATIERLLALTTDENTNVRLAAAMALGQIDVPVGLIEQLSEFWRKQLDNSELSDTNGQLRPVPAIAYTQLQQLAAQRERKLQP